MRARLSALLFPLFTVILIASLCQSCKKQTPPQAAETLRAHQQGSILDFPVVGAYYNWVTKENGCELTFACDTAVIPEEHHNPNLEVTILLTEPPVVASGAEWLNQPAYVDQEAMTNYYQWSHEGFEDFSVTILAVEGEEVHCRVSGLIKLNVEGRTLKPFTVIARFQRDKSLGRGVW